MMIIVVETPFTDVPTLLRRMSQPMDAFLFDSAFRVLGSASRVLIFIWAMSFIAFFLLSIIVGIIQTWKSKDLWDTPAIRLLAILYYTWLLPISLPIWLWHRLVGKAKNPDRSQIKWCKNCKHHRKSDRYEDVIRGLWRSELMPDSRDLPCNIAAEASEVWERYFHSKPNSRALYPKDCTLFRWRT